MLLISHDRDFLDRVVNAVIVPEGNGRWIEYAGGYSDMLAQRGADLTRAPAKTVRPAEAKPANHKRPAPARKEPQPARDPDLDAEAEDDIPF